MTTDPADRPASGPSSQRIATTDLFLVAFCLLHPWYSGHELNRWHADALDRSN